jgi:DNA-binding NarL/FixJ family response regulator
MIRILVVDDHPVVREGLMAVLSDEPDFRVVGQAETGEAALVEAVRLKPDVVVLDLRLPGISGTETCERLIRRHAGIRVVMLTSFPHDGAMMSAFGAGARGFVLKESEPTILRQAIRTVDAGDTYADPRVAAKVVAIAKGGRAKGPFDLSLSEMRVLEKLPQGLTNREIARELGVSYDTVKSQLRNAMRKLRAKDRAEATAIAMREGLA